MISRRNFLSIAAAAPAQQPSRRKPNFIVIYTDDQGIGDLGCYGARDVKTPHLDRLASRGSGSPTGTPIPRCVHRGATRY